jgi:jouberin
MDKMQKAVAGGFSQENQDIEALKQQRSWEKFLELPSQLPDRLLWKFESSA